MPVIIVYNIVSCTCTVECVCTVLPFVYQHHPNRAILLLKIASSRNFEKRAFIMCTHLHPNEPQSLLTQTLSTEPLKTCERVWERVIINRKFITLSHTLSPEPLNSCERVINLRLIMVSMCNLQQLSPGGIW